MYEGSANRMKGLVSDVSNGLNKYKSTIHTKKRDVLVASRAASKHTNTDDSTVEIEIANNSDAQDKANCQNVFRLAAIGINEGIAEGITKIVRRGITNPILRTKDNSNLKLVDQFQIHQLFTAIIEGLERPDSTNIRRQFVNNAGTILDWRETVVTNVECMAAMAAKSLGYSVRVHSNLRAVVILENTEWEVQQTWGADISVAHRKIVSKYRYNHSHATESIREVLRILATVDAAETEGKRRRR